MSKTNPLVASGLAASGFGAVTGTSEDPTDFPSEGHDSQLPDVGFVRKGQEIRTCSVTVEGTGEAQQTWVTGGFKDLVVLKSTGSEFADFYVDVFHHFRPAGLE